MYQTQNQPIDDMDERPLVREEADLETRHSIKNNILIVEHISYSQDIQNLILIFGQFLENLAQGKDLKIEDSTARLENILNKIEFIINKQAELVQISTRRRLIILANIMGLCYSLPDSLKMRYGFMIPEGWQIFPLFAYLIDYNYVQDEVGSIEYPVHHKLIITMLEQYFIKDIPAIYETFCQIYDIEQFKNNKLHQPKSNFFVNNGTELAIIAAQYSNLKEFENRLKTLNLICSLSNIVRTCEIADNYYSLKTIQALITRARSHKISKSNKEKQALLGCFVQIGEYVKHLSASLRQNIPAVPWQLYKDFRDYLEHPDEAGRYRIIEDLISGNLAAQNITLSRLKQELSILAKGVDEALTRFYNTPGLSFLQDCQSKLFTQPKNNLSFSVPPELKIDGKEKRKFYELKLGPDHYWQEIMMGKRGLADADSVAVAKASHAHPELSATINKIMKISDALLESQKIVKWSAQYEISKDKLQEFLKLMEKIDERDFWINVLNGQQITLSSNKIDETIQRIETTDSKGVKLCREVLDKIRPSCIQSLILFFNNHKENNLDNLGITSQITSYLDLVQGSLHDKLHDQAFMDRILPKAAKYAFDNHCNAVRNLNPASLKIMKELMEKYPNPNDISEREFDEIRKKYIDTGLHEYFEQESQLSPEQFAEINTEYNEEYDKKMSDSLKNDATFCDGLQYYFTIIFALVKKLIDQEGLIDPAIIPYLESLKKARNFLAHQDDYTAKIVRAEPHIHVELLGRETYIVHSYFELLHKKLAAKIKEPLFETLHKAQENIKQRLSKHTQSSGKYLFWPAMAVGTLGIGMAIANREKIEECINELCHIQ